MRHKKRKAMAAVAVLALTIAACETVDDDASPDDDVAAPGELEGIAFDVGVTDEPCPDAVNEDNGCIYLGIISDLTDGPFAPVGGPVTEAQRAFWQRVNEQGGIGGAFDVNVDANTRDNHYNPEIHNQEYQQIKGNVLALAQTLGSPTTAAIIDDMLENNIFGTPAGWTSLYNTDEPGRVIMESGANYCIEAMNAVDFYAEQEGGVDSVLVIHVPGDYGADGAAGVKIAAETHGAEFSRVEVEPGASGGALEGAVRAVRDGGHDVVIMFTQPAQLAEIVGNTVAQGFDGRFIGAGPTWNPALLGGPAGDALIEHYWQSRPWGSHDADTPGHAAMREYLGDLDAINWGYASGWIWSYPLLAALERAYELGDLTREGLAEAIDGLETVDYEGMLPAEAGNLAGDPDERLLRQIMMAEPDPESIEGVTLISDFYQGPSASAFAFEGACYLTVDLDA